MRLQVWKIKALAFAATFILFGTGRWFHYSVINKIPFETALINGLYYGIFTAFIFIFVADLMLANGLLQHKILFIKLLSVSLFSILICEKFLLHHFSITFPTIFATKSLLSILLFILVLVFDARTRKREEFIYLNSSKIPERYFKKRPLKTFFELLFRLFPHPEPVALYKIGNPRQSSPVLVTGNFELTIRRVIAALKGTDCWLLVCDSRGINIWCSTEAGHFGTEQIIQAIRLTKLSDKVNHRKLILPQLAASNVTIRRIKKETGFNSVFGPVNINSIAIYFKNPDERTIRKVTFNLPERIEASFCSPIILDLLLLFVFNFIGFSYLVTIIPFVYIFNFFHSIIFPRRIIKNVLLWAVFFGSITFIINCLIFKFLLPANFWINTLTISVGMVYLIMEFEGWSPLVKFSYGHYDKARISVIKKLCCGCKICIHVCPKSVFEIKNKKAYVLNENACVMCKSCFIQCPVNAIDHSMNKAKMLQSG